jgi:hypothetical protein
MCGDQGISSHDTGQMTIRGAEVAFCGSRAGGIADINDCVTSYSSVLLHNNRKSVLTLRGGKHDIDGMVIVAPNANALPKPSDKISVKNSFVVNADFEQISASADASPDQVKDLIEAARQAKPLLATVPYPGVPISQNP